MRVTGVEPVSKTRYKVMIDGQFAFTLYKGELSRYHIEAGSVIELDTYQVIYKNAVKRAKLRAMHLLTDMGRTEAQLRTKLMQGGYPQNITEEAIKYVKSFGYINDREYARNFVESRKDKKSRRELYAALCQKGLASELIEEVLEECFDKEDSIKAIKTLLRKKDFHPETADLKEKQKVMGYLLRKGFQYEEIKSAVDFVNIEE